VPSQGFTAPEQARWHIGRIGRPSRKERIMIRAGMSLISVLAVSLIVAAPVALGQDLRSPDARDAAAAPTSTVARGSDLRSPDTRDIAAGRSTGASTVVEIVRTPSGRAVGFAWGDAAVGAGIAGGLMLVGLGATLAVSRRRRQAFRARAVG
jgi:hypothetical protein